MASESYIDIGEDGEWTLPSGSTWDFDEDCGLESED